MSHRKKLAAFLLLWSCANALAAPVLTHRVLRSLPHDAAHFTQGLLLHEGRLYESTGREGLSALYKKELLSGRVLRETRLPADVFGEGLTLLRQQFYQLSYHGQRLFRYDAQLRLQRERRYRGDAEGWGLTDDGRQLISSHGQPELVWRDVKTLEERRRLRIKDGDKEIPWLNELEYARGAIFANVWQTDYIAIIHPGNGQVRAWLNLTELKSRFDKPAAWDAREHVLNGIAYDAAQDRFYVTGKCWPALFELEVPPLPPLD